MQMFTFRVGFSGVLVVLGALLVFAMTTVPEDVIAKRSDVLNPRLFGPHEMLAGYSARSAARDHFAASSVVV
ncbi:hypothetical protein SAMN02745866_00170 [Alteromonadaceae bacterium Bs31]|nr:hypothetical protein SAMN02745866_00170 [Alteromonadaceae bacterium Bs31]